MSQQLELTDRYAGAYLGLAIGDALGATVEFITPREISAKYGVHSKIIGGGWLRLPKGQVTDDTEMSLALGDSILAMGEVQPDAVAKAFDNWMRHQPIDIGNTVRRGIAYYRRTGETQVPLSENDAGNGACMRCLPIALAYLGADQDQVALANEQQSHVTHNSVLADRGTVTVIRMVQAALLGGKRGELEDLAQQLVNLEPRYRYDGRRIETPSGFIVDTLIAVFQSFFANDSFESALIDVVNRGGDADTTGAILGMLAGAYYGLDAIPNHWLKELDSKINKRCIEQAQRLLQLAQSKSLLNS